MLPKTIVVATDFSEQAQRAMTYAVDLAHQVGARVVLVNAYLAPPFQLPELAPGYGGVAEQAAEDAQRQLDQLMDGCHDRGVPVDAMLRCGDAVDCIVAVAKDVAADLIVIGTHGRKGLSRAVLGSVAENVVRSAPCAVLTVH